jgi:hypothetical protein
MFERYEGVVDEDIDEPTRQEKEAPAWLCGFGLACFAVMVVYIWLTIHGAR